MNTSRQRITGTEMEWPVQVRTDDSPYRQASNREVEQILRDCRHPDLKMAEPCSLLSNGGRYYLDVGDHPEYATPEDDSFMGTVANEIAGERIMYDTLETAKHRGVFKDFLVSKRVIDDEYKTWGYHMSFGIDSSLPIESKRLMPLGIHLATFGILTGSGAVVPVSENKSMFAIAQKTLNLNMDFSTTTHDKDQPLISLRDESLTDDEELGRMHITSTDANMSPWASWMKLGTTSIVLRMMEHSQLKSFANFEDDMHDVAMRVACDTSLNHIFTMEDGSRRTALDVQLDLIDQAKVFHKDVGLNDEELHIVAEWERAVYDLRQDHELLIDRVEWVARRHVLRRYMGKHGLGLSHDMVREKDRQWSYLGPLGIASRLRDSLWKKWMPPEAQIEHAYLYPPTTTRAFARGALIRQYAGNVDANLISTWNTVTVATTSADRKTYALNDPYNPVAVEVVTPASDNESETEWFIDQLPYYEDV